MLKFLNLEYPCNCGKYLFAFALVVLCYSVTQAQTDQPTFAYSVSITHPETHSYHVELNTSGWDMDTIQLQLPNWMPGYYQFMNYYNDLSGMTAKNDAGEEMNLEQINPYTWQVIGVKNQSFSLSYDIQTSKQFVANSYVDEAHAYLIPTNSFLYAQDYINTPVTVKILKNSNWKDIATGLELIDGAAHVYAASDFDVLFDSPILIGNLKELPAFHVKGIPHRFIGYKMGSFDEKSFMKNLEAVISSAVDVIGDIPFSEYTFIGIGPGRGGIEHLNNTTVSFDGSQLATPDGMSRMMSFLAHEYFHHYNAKRIRPVELGPFDYQNGSKTSQLWISEGLSVYFEYLIVKRAGVDSEEVFLRNFEQHINTVQNNPGRSYQSLVQSSYNTWNDGPFGGNEGKTISYYQKGPIVGLLLDFAIRNASQNEKTLDHVMQFMYWEYYKKKQRGFTDAEFQQACENIAGVPLSEIFEYVHTTKELDYQKYLGYGGLELIEDSGTAEKKVFQLKKLYNTTLLQETILNSWLGDQE
ncbi:M61 family peptidase [Algoriphagus sp. D3-2-R+10]|uniref:M61 family metallopeptidase n=1 Tax=Algoriphagus aurantiacus TaxID=3103948 RepID=UPI002B3A887D|nr:M61 family peptidase [Algoriphagus sp. D3-2-R+10]MEB2774141.1 M61 family peptidase [Algoriphagus sp. D3-2-R+10]